MDKAKSDYIQYRILRAKQTLHDAEILALNKSWSSAINRLYYACFYAVHALLFKHNINAKTHSGAKIKFFQEFIRTGKIDKEFSKLYSDLMDWRYEGDYADFIEFEEDIIISSIEKVKQFISSIEEAIAE